MSAAQTDAANELERIWRERIPLTASLDIRIAACDDAALVTRAPLAPNVNLHGTAFAGSLYAICALTGWGYVWRLGRTLGCDGDIVLARAEIAYRRPVTGEIVCTASAAEAAAATFADALAAGRPARCDVQCRIGNGNREAVMFSGNFRMQPTDCTAKAR